jgi:hypothetical protein
MDALRQKAIIRRALAGLFAVHLFLFLMDADCLAMYIDKCASRKAPFAAVNLRIENHVDKPGSTEKEKNETHPEFHWVPNADGGEFFTASSFFFNDPDCTKPALLKSKAELCGKLSVVLAQHAISPPRRSDLPDVSRLDRAGSENSAIDSIRTVVLMN